MRDPPFWRCGIKRTLARLTVSGGAALSAPLRDSPFLEGRHLAARSVFDRAGNLGPLRQQAPRPRRSCRPRRRPRPRRASPETTETGLGAWNDCDTSRRSGRGRGRGEGQKERGGDYAIDLQGEMMYTTAMTFLETRLFTARITEVMSDEDYAAMRMMKAIAEEYKHES